MSGLALTFLGTGISLALGEGLSKAGPFSLLPSFSIPLLFQFPLLGPIFFEKQSILVYLGYLMIPLVWYCINRTRPGLHLRSLGEYPSVVDASDINVFRMRYVYVFIGGMLAGLAGETISLAVGSNAFGALRRLILDIQGPLTLFCFDNPFYYNPYWGFFQQMMPYAFTVIVLVLGSREAIRKRLGAPAALGNPYIRGERGIWLLGGNSFPPSLFAKP